MKKINLLLVALCALLFAACTSSVKKESPSGIVTKYLDCVVAGDFDKAVQCFYFKEELQKEELTGLAAKLAQGYGKDGGLVKYEIVSEEIDQEDNTKANVNVKLFYKEGREDEETMKTVLNDGKWKIDYTVK
jgi:hypothetical protein